MVDMLKDRQVLLILRLLCEDLERNILITKFSWSNTDGIFHIHFVDAGGNKHHKTFNSLGHSIDWEE